jgi:hypothetical protein
MKIMAFAVILALIPQAITGLDQTHTIPCGEGYIFSADILNPIGDIQCNVVDGWAMVCLKSDPTMCIGEKL